MLQSLACGKFKILSKEPKGRDVHEDDRFYFNESFTAPVVRFKIQQIANRVETTEEGKATRSKVEDERKMLANVRVISERSHSVSCTLTQMLPLFSLLNQSRRPSFAR